MDTPLDFILEESFVEFYIVDSESFEILYANKAAQNNLGYTFEELCGSTPLLVSPQMNMEELQNVMDAVKSDGDSRRFVINNVHTRKNGTTYPVEAHVQTTRYQSRNVFFGYVFEVSEKQKELDQLRTVVQGANLGFWDFNKATDSYYLDENFLGMIGLKSGDIENSLTGWTRYIHPDDKEATLEILNASVKNGEGFTAEFRMLHVDNKIIWVRASGSVVAWDHEKNEALRVTGIHVDITKRKRDEQEKEQFQTFFDISNDIMFITKPDGYMVKINNAATRVLGFSAEELMAKPFIEFLHPDDREATLEVVEQNYRDGGSKNAVNRFLCKDGTYRWFSWAASVDMNDMLVYTSGRDITDQKKIERQLRKQQDIHWAFMENSEDVISLLDREHRYIYINMAGEKMLGVRNEDIVGKTRYELGFSDDLNEMWRENIEKVFVTGNPCYRYFEMETQLGETSVDWHVFPGLLNDDGEVDFVFSVSRNVTHSRKMEEELQRMQRLDSIGVLAGGIAHDFNNILTVLFGNISMARELVNDPQKCLENLEKAELAFNRASNLTSQLLTFAKGGDPVKQDVSLIGLIRETISFDLSGSNVKMELSADNDLWMARADKGQIAQVFSNLAINANQAMPNGGIISIKLENTTVGDNKITGLEPGRYIKAVISDEGIGISKDVLDHIFDPFYSTKQAGSGLGLSTVYSIVTKHNGHIRVSSVLGEGTEFELYLPSSEPVKNQEIRELSSTITVASSNNRILVMDDEELICELAEKILAREGYEVDVARNGDEAISMYKSSLDDNSPYDCLIMDLTIPGGLGGEKAVLEILSLNPNANVIVSSGYAVDPVMSNYEKYGFKGVITKPFTRHDLSSEVGRLLREQGEIH